MTSLSVGGMGNFDVKFLGHVTSEILIVGGVTFWLNGKISTLEKQNAVLIKKVEEMEQAISQLYAILRGETPPQQRQSAPKKQPQPSTEDEEEEEQKPAPKKQPKKKVPPPKVVKKNKKEKSKRRDDIDPEALISDELELEIETNV